MILRKIPHLACVTFVFSIIASDNNNTTVVNIPKTPDEQTRIRSLVNDFFEEQRWKQSQKFTTALGAVKGTYKDKSSSMHMKGHNRSVYISCAYQFSPDYSFSLTPIRSFSRSKTDAIALKTKSSDKALASGFDYKFLPWLTFNLSLTRKWGKSTTSIDNTANPDSVSKNLYNIPGVTCKFSVPITTTFFVLPDVGFSRTNIKNKAFVDNYRNNQKKQILVMDQLAFNSKACLLVNADVIPYVGLGYTKITKYKLHVKSKNSFKGNAGILLFGGAANLDWAVSKTNSSIVANNCTLNLSTKF
jgi:hypothetical protein